MQEAARAHGWTPFISTQDQYSLIYREQEREMFGLPADQGVGSLPWSPLAAGRLARPRGERSTTRAAVNPDTGPQGRPLQLESDQAIVDAVQRIADDRGVALATVALAWILRSPVVDAPIIGATKDRHLTDAAAALDLELTDEDVAALEKSPTCPASPPTSKAAQGSSARQSKAVQGSAGDREVRPGGRRCAGNRQRFFAMA